MCRQQILDHGQISMDLSDVTLATKDNGRLCDHKLILAASSPLFKRLLHKNSNIHPLLSQGGRRASALTKLLQIECSNGDEH